MKINLNIEGMHCNSCKVLIEDALGELGAKDIKVEIGKVSCDFRDKNAVIRAIEKEGYKVKK